MCRADASNPDDRTIVAVAVAVAGVPASERSYACVYGVCVMLEDALRGRQSPLRNLLSNTGASLTRETRPHFSIVQGGAGPS